MDTYYLQPSQFRNAIKCTRLDDPYAVIAERSGTETINNTHCILPLALDAHLK